MKFICGILLLSSGALAQNCPLDIKTCPDGQTLNRNPTDNCNFPLCVGEKNCQSASTGASENLLKCPSGTMRKRDGFNNCEFEQCDDPRCILEDYKQCPSPNLHMYVARDPTVGPSGCDDWLPCPGDAGTPTPYDTAGAATPGNTSACPQDVKTCPDGQTLNRNPTDNCNFPLCAGEKNCSSASTGTEENTLLCPSGTLRKRDGFNNCEFEQCDDPRCELEDYLQCPAPYLHMYRARDPTVGPSGCDDWLPCPTDGTPALSNNCPLDVKTCPDGQSLNRNPTDNCNFPLCAGEKNCSSASTGTEENTLLCPSGTLRKRDGFNNCEFEQCDDPRCELEDYLQCPAPYLHMYRARDPNAGSSGCADWLPCPTDVTPTPMADDTATEDDSSGAIATVGVMASAAVAAGLTMMM